MSLVASLGFVFVLLGGYFFGNIPVVKNNFSIVIVAIVIISVMPGFIAYFRQKFLDRRKATAELKGNQ